ncbi:MAG: chromate efflux transporter [Micavibrio sp.]|nr:chromate efflux transporter [Micavibrio sp.]
MIASSAPHPVPFRELLRTFFKIGLLSFGGPAGQIALMHKILVEEKNWISDARFMQALNYCMLLPGPEAMQLATYIGWLLHRTRGGLAAGLLFILPGATLMLLLSFLYARYHALPLAAGIFFGLKCAVMVVVIEALLRIGKRALRTAAHLALAAASFIALFFFAAPFPLIVLAAAGFGFAAARLAPHILKVPPAKTAAAAPAPSVIDRMLENGQLAHAEPCSRHATGTLLIGLALWLLPVLACIRLRGSDDVFARMAIFFSKMAVVTFGGAYAVLAYVAQQAVTQYHWLDATDMMNGLGLAETTPGPLILVLQHVGYLAAFRSAGDLPAPIAGALGAALTLWVTFVPCFLWIFLGAPYVERLRRHEGLQATLSAVTAAVTGVILNLAIWFALHVLFARLQPFSRGPFAFEMPVWSSLNPIAILIAALAAVLLLILKRGMAVTLAVCAAVGMVLSFI